MNPCRKAVKPFVVFSIPVVFFGFRGPWSLSSCNPVYQFLWHQFEICKIHTQFLLWLETRTPDSSYFCNSKKKHSQING